MVNIALAKDYLKRARIRFEAKKAKRIAEKFLMHTESLIEEDLSKGGLNL